MALIDIRDLTFAYPGSYDNVFEHLSLQLDTHWRLGLVGRNGRGKTTLLRILTGVMDYDEGEVMIAPGKRMGLIPDPGLSGGLYRGGCAGHRL